MELDTRCDHPDAYIEKACCSPWDVGDSGYVECACGGRDAVVCPAPFCDWIDTDEFFVLWDRLIREYA